MRSPEDRDTNSDYRGPLSPDALVELGEIRRSHDPFVQEVAAVSMSEESMNSELRCQTGGLITSKDAPNLDPIRCLGIALEAHKRSPYSYGYITTSVHHSREKEALWAAIVAHEITQAGFHPLVIPIDAFYAYPGPDNNPSIPRKIRSFTRTNYLSKEDGRPHAIVMTDIAESRLFDEATLRNVPMQSVARAAKLFVELVAQLPELIKKFNGVHGLWQEIVRLHPDPNLNEAIKLVLCTALLGRDNNNWQMLWHFNTPLIIVAPQSFHDAMNRLNYSAGMCTLEYSYRASLAQLNFPIFDTRPDGAIYLDDPEKRPLRDYQRTQEAYHSGVSPEQFAEALEVLRGLI